MDIHYVRHAKLGCTTGALHADKSLVISGAWHWKKWQSLELPCKYCSLGCPDIFPYYSKIKHEAQCSFRPYNCPYAGSECAVAGDIPFLVSHLRDDHKVDMHSGCTFNHRYVKSNPREVENATWMLTVSFV
jgi:E3 ubiquitin-protein ligase SIAH1